MAQIFTTKTGTNPLITSEQSEAVKKAVTGAKTPEQLVLGSSKGIFENILPGVVEQGTKSNPLTQLPKFSPLPDTVKPEFISNVVNIEELAAKKDLFTPDVAGATQLGVTEFVAPETAEAILQGPIFQARQAEIGEQFQRNMKAGIESLAARGIVDSGATQEFTQRLIEDANRASLSVFADLAEKQAGRSEREAGRETEFLQSGARTQAELDEAAAGRTQRVNEIANQNLIQLGMSEGDLKRAFDADTTGLAREEFFRFLDYQEKLLNLPVKQQQEEMAYQQFYLSQINLVLSGQQPVSSLAELQINLQARSDELDKALQAKAVEADRDREAKSSIARGNQTSKLIGDIGSVIGTIGSKFVS